VIFLSPNVEEHTPLSARASFNHGVETECGKGHENRAVDRGVLCLVVFALVLVENVDYSARLIDPNFRLPEDTRGRTLVPPCLQALTPPN
jgi:hypothetical protein